jgi:hypothetical protein
MKDGLVCNNVHDNSRRVQIQRFWPRPMCEAQLPQILICAQDHREMQRFA